MQNEFRWSEEKNRRLMQERGISFEEIHEAIREGRLLEVRNNTSRNFRHQRVFIVDIDNYPWIVPFEETSGVVTLKTAYPSRKLKRELDDHAQADKRRKTD